MATQLELARAGQMTDVIRRAAAKEPISAEQLRDEVAAGRAVVPANRVHLETNLVPAAIGRAVTIKVNGNIGVSSVRSSLEGEIEKMRVGLEAGADAMMDLSTGGDLDAIRRELIARCTAPFGTVPIYEVIVDRAVEEIDYATILKVAEKQARQGVDFFTIHAGLLREHLDLIGDRVCGIVSRGGALMAKWMAYHGRQNPMYELFDELCAIMREYDVCFSLGDGLRPGCIADATDAAQLAELRTLGDLVLRARDQGCQVMVEGPGHVPFDQIQRNMELQKQWCHGAPFYVLGPLVTDIAPGYDHITSAIGATAAGFYGASFICYVTPREHLGLPNADDVRQGVIAARIAAHAADVARGLAGAADRDRRLSVARAGLDWQTHLDTAIDPPTARRMYEEACRESSMDPAGEKDFCTMCGKNWCSVRINKELREMLGKRQKAGGRGQK
jgi:phosphomethylpyrimidine synthase